MEGLAAVRQALATLLQKGADTAARRQADLWLQAWRASPGSWRTCLALVHNQAQLPEQDRYFFACSLRFACQKFNGDILEQSSVKQVVDQAASALVALFDRGTGGAVAGQLSAAIAAIAVRAPLWDPNRVVTDLAVVFQEHQQNMMLTAGGPALLALLHVLKALPAECSSKQVSCHPNRRNSVTEALRNSDSIVGWVQAALACQGSHGYNCAMTSMSVLEEWCNLGGPPMTIEDKEEMLQQICQKCLHPETAAAGASCMSALLKACVPTAAGTASSTSFASSAPSGMAASKSNMSASKGPSKPGKSGPPGGADTTLQGVILPSLPTFPQLLQALVAQWQSTLNGAGYSTSLSSNPEAPNPLDPRPHAPGTAARSKEVQLGVCAVMCSSAEALLGPALAATSAQEAAVQYQQATQYAHGYMVSCQQLFMVVAQQLLQHLRHADDEVALSAADFFSGTYLPSLQALQDGSLRKAVLAHHTPLLQHLASTLIARTQLRPEVAATATADARDIPEEARTVRRELAGALRDISSLVGHQSMLQYTMGLVQQSLSAFLVQGEAEAAPEGQQQQQQQSTGNWIQLECIMYAANVVLGRWGSDQQGQRQQQAQQQQQQQHRPFHKQGSNDGLGMKDQPDMSSSAAPPGDSADATVKQLVWAAATCVLHSKGAPKLSGTALTLLGGLSAWFAAQSSQHTNCGSGSSSDQASEASAASLQPSKPDECPLVGVLVALTVAISSPDAKLSRNGATTLQRLCQNEVVARHLLGHHQKFADDILMVYSARGGMRHRAGPHEDSSTEELLLVVLCRLAALSGSNSGSSLLLHLAAPQVQEVQQALEELADSAQVNDISGGSSSGIMSQQHPGALRSVTLSAQCSRCFEVLTAIMDSCGKKLEGMGGIGPKGSRGNSSSNLAAMQQQAQQRQGSRQQVQELVKVTWSMLQRTITPQLLQAPAALEALVSAAAFMASALRAAAPLPGEHSQPLTAWQEPLAWALSLAEVLPPQLLAAPRAGELLTACLELHSQLRQQQQQRPAEAAPMSAELLSITNRLTIVVHAAVASGCSRALDHTSPVYCSVEYTESLLALCCASVRYLPACLAVTPSTLESLLAATIFFCQTYDADQCRAVLDWCALLCTAPYNGSSANSLMARQQLQQLGLWLDCGAGARVLLALMLAASYTMPPNMMLPISTAVYNIWCGIGTDRFVAWMQHAIGVLTPHDVPAPWLRLKPEHKLAFIHELVHPDCMVNTIRFKKTLKAFCGGKKKGGGHTPMGLSLQGPALAWQQAPQLQHVQYVTAPMATMAAPMAAPMTTLAGPIGPVAQWIGPNGPVTFLTGATGFDLATGATLHFQQ